MAIKTGIRLSYGVSVPSLGSKAITFNGYSYKVGTITEVTSGHFIAHVIINRTTYSVSGYSTAATALAALQVKANTGNTWRR